MSFRPKPKRKSVPYQCQFELGKHKLKQVVQMKYLGVIFDEKLSWKPNVKIHLCSELSSES